MPNALNQSKNALLILDNGAIFSGYGFGAETVSVGEICFNTSMTGYQEILTDPSYAGQIINFTFPHIGNVGTNQIDMETDKPVALGLVTRNQITSPSNWRNHQHFDEWLKIYRSAPEVDAAEAAERQHRREQFAQKIIELDPDRQMIVQVYGEETTQAIENAIML